MSDDEDCWSESCPPTCTNLKFVSEGNHGIVHLGKLCSTGKKVAIKTLKYLNDDESSNSIFRQYFQSTSCLTTKPIVISDVGTEEDSDEEAASRNKEVILQFDCDELRVMRRLQHVNIVKLFYSYNTINEENEVLLKLVMEYVPTTLKTITKKYRKSSTAELVIPIIFVKVFMYQLFRGLAYLHSLHICHGCIKPKNILIDLKSGLLKICDFGRAKHVANGERAADKISRSSLTYRPPEALLGDGRNCTLKLDMWSAGCILAALLSKNSRIFPGRNLVDQLAKIIKVLGTPSPEQLADMVPNHTCDGNEHRFLHCDAQLWCSVLPESATPEGISLVSSLLVYSPASRISALEACVQSFFDELRKSAKSNLRASFPELDIDPNLNRRSYYSLIIGMKGSAGGETIKTATYRP